jgi:hypothetical protein
LSEALSRERLDVLLSGDDHGILCLSLSVEQADEIGEREARAKQRSPIRSVVKWDAIGRGVTQDEVGEIGGSVKDEEMGLRRVALERRYQDRCG